MFCSGPTCSKWKWTSGTGSRSASSPYFQSRTLYPADYSLLTTPRASRRRSARRTPIETCRHCGGEIKDYGGHRGAMNPNGVNLNMSGQTSRRSGIGSSRVRSEAPIRSRPSSYSELWNCYRTRTSSCSTPSGGAAPAFSVAESLGRYRTAGDRELCDAILERFRPSGSPPSRELPLRRVKSRLTSASPSPPFGIVLTPCRCCHARRRRSLTPRLSPARLQPPTEAERRQLSHVPDASGQVRVQRALAQPENSRSPHDGSGRGRARPLHDQAT